MPHAIRLHHTGPPEVLRWESTELGDPGPGEVKIRQTAIGVNFIDTYHRSGLYPLASLPSGIGMEAVGTVLEVGPGVTQFRAGDRAGYVSGPVGAYAEQRIVAEERLIPLPDEVDDATGAAVLLKAMIVETLIHRVCRVERGQTVLLHAAAGGVGLIACQWLTHLGARVLAVVGSPAKAERARVNGAAEVIDSSAEDFVEKVRAHTQDQGVPIVFDSVGKATFRRSIDCLAPRGVLVLYGNASGKPHPLDPQDLAARSLTLTRPVLFHYIATRPELLACADRVFLALRSGVIRSQIGQRFALRDAERAHRALESRETTGSTLLISDSP